MFSNDQNIETIGQLVDVLKHYAGLQKEYLKLGTVEKTVRILTAIAMTAILGLLLVFVLTFLSFAAVSALTPCGTGRGLCYRGRCLLHRFPPVHRLQKTMDREAARKVPL